MNATPPSNTQAWDPPHRSNTPPMRTDARGAWDLNASRAQGANLLVGAGGKR